MTQFPFIVNGRSEYTIVMEKSEPAQFAAKELQRYIKQSTGVSLNSSHSISENSIILSVNPSPDHRDGFEIHFNGQTLHLTGKTPISLVYAVYHFLETFAGIRFFSPDYEYIPVRSQITIPADYHYEQTASFKVRQISTELSFDAKTVDWAVKNRFNCICATMAFWQGEKGPEVLNAVQARGMSIGLTGHLLFELLKADEYFKDHPEWFPEVNGERKPTKNSGDNFCYSNSEAVKVLAENLKLFSDKYPQLSFISLWQGDGGLVCTCEKCKREPFMVLYGKTVSQVADILTKTHPHINVGQLAYNFYTPNLSMEMMKVPPQTAQVPTMFAFWGQNLTAPFETNPDPNHQIVLTYIKEYCQRNPGAGAIFSYHTDTYMNSNLCPIFEPAMSADFKLFKQLKIDQVCLLWIPWSDLRQNLTHWIAWQNGSLYGRCAMDSNFSINHYRNDYYATVFGQNNIQIAEDIWSALNESLQPLFELTWSFAPYRFSDAWGCGFNRSVFKWELTTDYKSIGRTRLAIFEKVASNLTRNLNRINTTSQIKHPELDRLREYYDHCLKRANGLMYIIKAQYAMQANQWQNAINLLQNALDTGMDNEKDLTLEWQIFCKTKLEVPK